MSDLPDEERERLVGALERIARWSDAYPIGIFPEPDDEYCRRAHAVLAAQGMTLDRLSAAAMRHVIKGVGRMAKEALGKEE